MSDEARSMAVAGRLSGLILTDPVLLRRGDRNLVLRCGVRGHAPIGSVVIKAAHGQKDLLATEAAALKLLGAHPSTRELAPYLLAYDPAERVMVMEAVMPAQTLEELLKGNDPLAARQALIATARSLGRLHGSTSQLNERQSATLPMEQAANFLKDEPVIRAFFDRAGVPLSPGALAELRLVARALSRPKERLAFTVGDMAPSNVLITPAGAVFIDLEYAGFRHAFYDAVFWRCICPLSSESAAMDEAYRQGCREEGMVLTDAGFTEAMTLMTAHRALWSLTWGAAALWQADRDWAPQVGGRYLVRRWLRGFHALARTGTTLPELALAAEKFDVALGHQWPETDRGQVLFQALGPQE